MPGIVTRHYGPYNFAGLLKDGYASTSTGFRNKALTPAP